MSRKPHLEPDECRRCGGGGDLPHPRDPQEVTYCRCPAGQRLRAEDREVKR